MPHPLWQTLATDAGTALTSTQLEQLDRYLAALIEWNQKLNLTRIVDRADAEVRHIADALTLLRFIPPTARTLADVGTGGGVPGVPLAIARPRLRVTLIDSTAKKLSAIEQMLATVEVSNVRTRHARAEAMREQFDVVTARGVADLDTLLGWCAPLMNENGVLLAMKGPRVQEEIAAIPMRRRKQFRIDVVPTDVPELAGHCVARVTFA